MIEAKESEAAPSGLADYWRRVGEALGVEVSAPTTVELPSGAVLPVDALVAGFGGRRGMVVVANETQLGTHREELRGAGYGYSVWAPRKAGSPVDVSSAMSVLHDWEWHGPAEQAPGWYRWRPTDPEWEASEEPE